MLYTRNRGHIVADIKSQKGGSANARKVGMVGKLEFFFVMETGTGRWGGNGREVSK